MCLAVAGVAQLAADAPDARKPLPEVQAMKPPATMQSCRRGRQGRCS
jgi:hypothetical protein